MNHVLIDFGDRLWQCRFEREMFEEELADATGLDRTFIRDIEHGECNPSYLDVLKLARGLGMTPSALLEGVSH